MRKLDSTVNFHDGEIKAISLSENQGKDRCDLIIQLESTQRLKISFLDVKLLRANGLRIQNIIMQIHLVDANEAETFLKSRATALDLSPESIAHWTELIFAGEVVLVDLSASVGCELLCICKKVEVSETD